MSTDKLFNVGENERAAIHAKVPSGFAFLIAQLPPGADTDGEYLIII